MDDRKNNLLLGIILLILGLYILSIRYLRFTYGLSLPITLLGASLLFLYYTKKKTWALFLGVIILILCASKNLRHIPIIGKSAAGALLFIVPGGLLLLRYKQEGCVSCVIPGCFLIWAGIFMLVTAFPVWHSMTGALFFLCFGMVFLSAYFVTGQRLGFWYLIFSVLLFLAGFLFLKGVEPIRNSFHHGAYYGSLFLLALSFYIFYKGMKER